MTAHFQWVRQLTGRRSRKEPARRRSQLDPRDPEAARHARARCGRRQPDPDAAGSVVPCADADAPAAGDVVAARPSAGSCRRSPTHPRGAVISGATTVIQTLYNQQVVPTCSSLIANRYPFASSATDVQLADFGHGLRLRRALRQVLHRAPGQTGGYDRPRVDVASRLGEPAATGCSTSSRRRGGSATCSSTPGAKTPMSGSS